MALMFGRAENAYGDTALLIREVLPWLAILVALIIVIARLSGLRLQHSLHLGWISLAGIVPTAIVLIGAGLRLASGPVDWSLVGAVAIGVLLVGIGEETTFRGIVLNGLGERISVLGAVIASSILFGLLHAANLTVQGVAPTLVQIVITAFIGLLFAWIYVGTRGNLLLVIALHALYDFAVIVPQATETPENPFGTVIVLAMIILSLVLTVVGVRRYRGRHLSDVLA
jgi:membrane protease YdiL (CAAX protease family)